MIGSGVSSAVVTDSATATGTSLDWRDADGDGGDCGIDGAVVDPEGELVGAVEILRRGVGEVGRSSGERAVCGSGHDAESQAVEFLVASAQDDREWRVFGGGDRFGNCDRGVVDGSDGDGNRGGRGIRGAVVDAVGEAVAAVEVRGGCVGQVWERCR